MTVGAGIKPGENIRGRRVLDTTTPTLFPKYLFTKYYIYVVNKTFSWTDDPAVSY